MLNDQQTLGLILSVLALGVACGVAGYQMGRASVMRRWRAQFRGLEGYCRGLHGGDRPQNRRHDGHPHSTCPAPGRIAELPLMDPIHALAVLLAFPAGVGLTSLLAAFLGLNNRLPIYLGVDVAGDNWSSWAAVQYDPATGAYTVLDQGRI